MKQLHFTIFIKISNDIIISEEELNAWARYVFFRVWYLGRSFWLKKSITSRERPKSALYLRLKKREVFKIVKGGPFGFFETPVVAK